MTNLLERAQGLSGQLVAWRHHLHQIPEVDMDLPQTTAYISSELDKMNLTHQILPNGAGILGELGQGERTLLLRSDIDALPIKEESGETFASTNGCMHACGHDLHATVLLGALSILKAEEETLGGRVRFLFQTGEETMSGAKEVVRQGHLEGVDAAFAAHAIAQIPVGVFCYGEHAMASCTTFAIHVQGQGGHGSMPNECIDPIHAGVHTYLALEELIARECGGTEEVVLTIGSFNAGVSSNIIPDSAELQGTLRTFDLEKRDYMIARIQEILQGVDLMSRTKSSFEILNNADDVRCDKAFMEECVQSIHALNPNFHTIEMLHGLASEDFAAISQVVPTCYLTFGAAVGDGKGASQHNPHVRFNDKALPIGAALYVQVAHDYFKNHKA